MLVGVLIGISVAIFEVLSSLVRQQDVIGARKKLVKTLLGGMVGGLLGGFLYLLLGTAWEKALGATSGHDSFWTPTCWGMVALGMCIGLLVGLAQVILREAWLKVEAGFRPGREMILAKDKFTIGRAEACDLGLFGDNTIEKLHAQIVLDQGRYYIEDTGTPAGTYVNDRPVGGRTPLNSGDLIRIGKSSVRFNERQKRTA
jgi:FHA domain